MAEYGTVREATEACLKVAGHLTTADDGAVQALRALADKIDTDEALRDAYIEWQEHREIEPVKPLQMDNVSIPTYLKFCDALGLTPAGRERLSMKEAPVKGKLAQLRAVRDAG